LAEVVARVVITDGVFTLVRLSAGGVAPVPIRLSAAETVAQGAPVSPATIAAAARAATQGAKPLPMTAYKLDLLSGLVQDVMEQCAG
jgi:xanthine dehydrogenase YagS FAD-binding subunit